jgi:type 1 glutamine amidotransferase
MFRILRQLTIVVLLTTVSYAQKPTFKVVAFYNTTVEMDHVLFANDALYFLRLIAQQNNFSFDATSDWTNLNDTYLSNYQVVVWLNDSPHTAEQKAAFEKYIKNGGAWLGFHVAGYNDKSSNWPWFLDFLGGPVFHSNNWPPMAAKVNVENQEHPVTKRMPKSYDSPVTEWYQWKPSPRLDKDVKVLVSLAPEVYPLGVKTYLSAGDTPVVWTNTRYKMLYMNFGHGNKVLSNSDQNRMITDGILWLGGQLGK